MTIYEKELQELKTWDKNQYRRTWLYCRYVFRLQLFQSFTTCKLHREKGRLSRRRLRSLCIYKTYSTTNLDSMPKPIREYLFYVSGSWTISVKSNDLRQAIKKAKTQISNPNHPTAIWLFQHDKHNNQIGRASC